MSVRHKTKTIKNGQPQATATLTARHRTKTIKNGQPQDTATLAARHRTKTIKNGQHRDTTTLAARQLRMDNTETQQHWLQDTEQQQTKYYVNTS